MDIETPVGLFMHVLPEGDFPVFHKLYQLGIALYSRQPTITHSTTNGCDIKIGVQLNHTSTCITDII